MEIGLWIEVEKLEGRRMDVYIIDPIMTTEYHDRARRFYNSALTQLRNSIQIFPGSIFAACAGEAANLSYFETDAASRQPVNARDYL